MKRDSVIRIEVGGRNANEQGRAFVTHYNSETGKVRLKIRAFTPKSLRRILSLPYGSTPVVARHDKKTGKVIITHREESNE